jgi:hypothetical protein
MAGDGDLPVKMQSIRILRRVPDDATCVHCLSFCRLPEFCRAGLENKGPYFAGKIAADPFRITPLGAPPSPVDLTAAPR